MKAKVHYLFLRGWKINVNDFFRSKKFQNAKIYKSKSKLIFCWEETELKLSKLDETIKIESTYLKVKISFY